MSSVQDFDYAPEQAFYVDLTSLDDQVSEQSGSGEEWIEQTITFEQMPPVSLSKKTVNVIAYSDSALGITLNSVTPKICRVINQSIGTVQLLTSGTCTIVASQAGDDTYLPADDVEMSFKINPVVTAKTITKTPSKTNVKPSPTPTPKIAPKK